MKLSEILNEEKMFRHNNGQSETLDDYGKKTVKKGNKAGRRMKHREDKKRKEWLKTPAGQRYQAGV